MKLPVAMFFRRGVFVSLLFLAVLLAGGFWWRHSSAPTYQTVAVKHADIEDKVSASGVLQPVRKVDVGAQVSGQLQKLHVQLGQAVKKGDLLATVDASIAGNDLLNMEATLEQQAAQRESKQSDLDQAERELARQSAMLASDAASRSDVELAENKLKMLKGDLRALEAQIRQTQTSIASARTKLGYTRIAAPMDGEVVNITAQEGQTLISAQQAPTIMTLARLDTMMVKAQVSEADVARLRPGQAVYFTTLGDAEVRHSGKLRVVQPTPEKINNAIFYNALFDVPNAKRELWTDMTVLVSLILNEVKHVLIVPVVALGEKDNEGRYTVRVLNADGTISQRKIRIGLNDHINAQILEGLTEGEPVITAEKSLPTKADAPAKFKLFGKR